MEIQEVIAQIKDKFGDKVDISAITEKLKDVDLSKFNFNEILDKLNLSNLVGDLDGDGVKESFFEEVKGNIGGMFGK